MAAWRTSAGGKDGGAGDRLLHQAVERALPHLAHQQLDQEAPAAARRRAPEAPQRPYLRSAEPAPALRRQRAITSSTSARVGGRTGGRAFGLRGLERPPADADAALGQGAREVEGGECGLVAPRLPEEVGDPGHLLGLAGGGPDHGRRARRADGGPSALKSSRRAAASSATLARALSPRRARPRPREAAAPGPTRSARLAAPAR